MVPQLLDPQGGVFLCSGIIDTRGHEVAAALAGSGAGCHRPPGKERLDRPGSPAGVMAMQASVHPLTLPPDRRVLVVSDIHGNLPFLQGLLKKVGYSSDDILIVLGDILEKSTGGLDTLHYLMDLSRRNTVYFLQGNCEDVTLSFLRHAWPDEAAAQYGQFWGRNAPGSTWPTRPGWAPRPPRTSTPPARPSKPPSRRRWPSSGPCPPSSSTTGTSSSTGACPGRTGWQDLTARACMKNDDFLNQGHAFQRWVIVGHWPVTLYRKDIPSAKPLVLPDRHIVSIDGGCNLKADGQLNALILPKEPGEDFAWLAYDGFPVMVAQEDQAPSPNPINIRWGHSALEVLSLGEEFSRCRHLESRRELDILTALPPPGPGRALLPGLHRLSAARPGGGPAGHRPPHQPGRPGQEGRGDRVVPGETGASMSPTEGDVSHRKV